MLALVEIHLASFLFCLLSLFLCQVLFCPLSLEIRLALFPSLSLSSTLLPQLRCVMEDYTADVEAKKASKQKNLASAKNTVDAAAMASQENNTVCAAGPVSGAKSKVCLLFLSSSFIFLSNDCLLILASTPCHKKIKSRSIRTQSSKLRQQEIIRWCQAHGGCLCKGRVAVQE